jgi:hypothetical protein
MKELTLYLIYYIRFSTYVSKVYALSNTSQPLKVPRSWRPVCFYNWHSGTDYVIRSHLSQSKN